MQHNKPRENRRGNRRRNRKETEKYALAKMKNAKSEEFGPYLANITTVTTTATTTNVITTNDDDDEIGNVERETLPQNPDNGELQMPLFVSFFVLLPPISIGRKNREEHSRVRLCDIAIVESRTRFFNHVSSLSLSLVRRSQSSFSS